jgi:hypothetical protein
MQEAFLEAAVSYIQTLDLSACVKVDCVVCRENGTSCLNSEVSLTKYVSSTVHDAQFRAAVAVS